MEMGVQGYKKRFEELRKQKGDLLNGINKKIDIIRDKSTNIKELIDKAKLNSDRSTIEILSKWEEANQKILEKYPEGKQVDLEELNIKTKDDDENLSKKVDRAMKRKQQKDEDGAPRAPEEAEKSVKPPSKPPKASPRVQSENVRESKKGGI